MTLFEKIQILMGLGALFGLFNIVRTREKWSSIITGVYVLCIAANFVDSAILKKDAYYLFTLMAVVTSIYAFSIPDFSKEKRYYITAIAILSTLPNFFLLAGISSSFPGLIAIVPIGLVFYLIYSKREEYKNELGFIVILGVNALISFFLSTMFLLG